MIVGYLKTIKPNREQELNIEYSIDNIQSLVKEQRL
jgi:hypothetical protein